MTNLADFDRALAAFLEDGPNTAPEAPVIAAMAHARTTPRRPDPLRLFRQDVMAPRRAVSSRGVAAIGLAVVLIAGLGVAVGSRPTNPAVVPPSDSVLPSPSFSVAPSPSPSDPVRSPFSTTITLAVSAGSPIRLVVSDQSGALRDATTGTPGDGASVEMGLVSVTADPGDPNVLIATWTGGPCESTAAMTVNETTSTISVTVGSCSGDAIALDRVVRLTFDTPMDAGDWHGNVTETRIESPAP